MTASTSTGDRLKALTVDVIYLLLDEPLLVKYSPPTTPRQRRPTVHKASDRWVKLDSLLFPYMIYNLKAFSVASRTDTSSAYGYSFRINTSTTTSKSKSAKGMLKAFAKSNIGSEPAVNHASQLLADLASPLVDPHQRDAGREELTKEWSIKFRRLNETRMQACISTPNGLDFVWETVAASTPHTLSSSRSSSRARSCSSSSTSSNYTAAGTSLNGETAQVWKLRKFTFSDSDDEEHYWRPWEMTLSDAEADYTRFQQQDFKTQLAPLAVGDLDWDSVTSRNDSSSSHSHSNSDDQDTITTNHSWSIFGSSTKSQSQAPSVTTALRVRGSTIVGPRKKPGKPIGGGSAAVVAPIAVSAAALARAPDAPADSIADPSVDTHIYNHHNDYVNPDPDFTEDYAYNQAHPVFKHDFDDDDDLFGVCHGMVEEQAKPVAVALPVASEPHLQRIIGGDHDSEAAYWDLYDDEIEY